MSKTHIDEGAQMHDRLKEETLSTAQFSGSDVSGQAIRMLDALIASYAMDLVRVAPEGLIRIQSALQQAQILRSIFKGDALDTPKI